MTDTTAGGNIALRGGDDAAGQWVIERDGVPIGTIDALRLWGSLPFGELIRIDEPHRRHGNGRAAVAACEREMARRGHRRVLTSTQVDEDAQHFWRALGYVDCGALLLPDQAAELFLIHELQPG